jgi:ATP/maltotriose-dependent transcriptional regulator MalT
LKLSRQVIWEITPENCDLLLERKDSRTIPASLQRRYFLLSPLAGENTYRYHPLVRDFLLERLGDGRFELLSRAGKTALKTGEIDRAACKNSA